MISLLWQTKKTYLQEILVLGDWLIFRDTPTDLPRGWESLGYTTYLSWWSQDHLDRQQCCCTCAFPLGLRCTESHTVTRRKIESSLASLGRRSANKRSIGTTPQLQGHLKAHNTLLYEKPFQWQPLSVFSVTFWKKAEGSKCIYYWSVIAVLRFFINWDIRIIFYISYSSKVITNWYRKTNKIIINTIVRRRAGNYMADEKKAEWSQRPKGVSVVLFGLESA